MVAKDRLPIVLSVAELSEQLRGQLENSFANIWVSGEVSNLNRHANGHWYFTLKDGHAQIGAVLFRNGVRQLRFDLRDGLKVIAQGRVTVYPPQGRYQLAVNELQPKGMGAYELAFQQLKEKLAQRGWFDAARKKPLPRFPRRIALVTSRSGAAIQDMLRIIPRRWPAAEIWVCPTTVQGVGAAAAIARAIRGLNTLPGIDVMIVGRGGGSIEDLWAFNEEPVAEAIFRSRIPVISAVGHEVDVTIADYVADKRAATPSEAAELVVPDEVQLRGCLADALHRASACMQRRCELARRQLSQLASRRVFRYPLQGIRDQGQTLDDAAARLHRAAQRINQLASDRIAQLAARLHGLSPLNVLRRGYSLTLKAGGSELLRSAASVQIGDQIETRLAHGRLTSRVESLTSENAPP